MTQEFALSKVLDKVYPIIREKILCDRLGIAVLDDDRKSLRLYWMKSEIPASEITDHYSVSINSSSLKDIIETGKPRIINDLEEYYDIHPRSESTEKILHDGIRSNLTLPLYSGGQVSGVVFFSSTAPFTYKSESLDEYQEISECLSLIVERDLLTRNFP